MCVCVCVCVCVRARARARLLTSAGHVTSRAFHQLARSAHPDRPGGGDEARYLRIRTAYEGLSGVRLTTLHEALQATHADMEVGTAWHVHPAYLLVPMLTCTYAALPRGCTAP